MNGFVDLQMENKVPTLRKETKKKRKKRIIHTNDKYIEPLTYSMRFFLYCGYQYMVFPVKFQMSAGAFLGFYLYRDLYLKVYI